MKFNRSSICFYCLLDRIGGAFLKKTRNMNTNTTDKQKEWDETFQMISWWKTEEVRKAKIMIVGSGALGNEVLKNLALLNVGNIVIIDFDFIEYSNLSRSVLFRESDCEQKRLKVEVASERVKDINPNVKTKVINGDVIVDVGLGVFRRMDAIIGCLDNRLARLFLNRSCHKVGKVWVDGAIENLGGQLNVYKPGTSCYECQLTEAEKSNIRYRLGCPDVAQRNANAGRIPTTPISASIIAALQTQEALKIVMGNDENSMAGERFFFEGMSNLFLQYDSLPIKEDCLSHYEYKNIIEIKELSVNLSIGEAMAILSKVLDDSNPVIELDHELVLEIATGESKKSIELVIPRPHLSEDVMRQYQEVPDELIIITKQIDVIKKDFVNQKISLQEVGIPPLHILSVIANGERHFVECTGDEAFLTFE